MWRSTEVTVQPEQCQEENLKLNARSGSSGSTEQANLLVSKSCLYNDDFKAYKTRLQVLCTEQRKLDVAGRV